MSFGKINILQDHFHLIILYNFIQKLKSRNYCFVWIPIAALQEIAYYRKELSQ